MTTDPKNNDPQEQDDWQIYLQVFLDESDEDIESLVQALLRLEDDPHDSESLNEAFRLLHTYKGSAGLMGFQGISELAHELENRFEQFRLKKATLDGQRITVLLQCVDFLRTFNTGLRAGESPQQDASHIIHQLEEIERHSGAEDSDGNQPTNATSNAIPISIPSMQGGYRVRIEFEDGLQLADMKARLIVARLSDVGEIIATDPPVDDMQSRDDLSGFTLIVLTDRVPADVLEIANVDGVKSVQIEGGGPATKNDQAKETQHPESEPPSFSPTPVENSALEPTFEQAERPASPPVDSSGETVVSLASDSTPDASSSPAPQTDRTAVAETVRVGIDRLDALMNLTGELVVTKARFVQIAGEMNTVFRSSGMSNCSSGASERLRTSMTKVKDLLSSTEGEESGLHKLFHDLEKDLAGVQQQYADWKEGCHHFTRITKTIDQLSRVSDNLQQVVLETRMVPVAPLFNRFRRVIRDLSGERNKQVQLVIHGEQTELDKRMIDELGDPLLHLVRNSLDHGIESPDQRRQQGKSETGTIVLEASHSGNNVFITIRDDGGGLNLDRIGQCIIQRGLATESAVAEMSEQQVIDHIWHPGFSTAEQVTDISGRGVGMDVVRNRITDLNGSIEVETKSGEGTIFKLRLPLTLAIIRCLLVRFRTGSFSMPIDDVREIVTVGTDRVHSVHGSETIDVRGQLIPLIRMDRVFHWHDIEYQSPHTGEAVDSQNAMDAVNVVITHTAGRTIGLCVDELCGTADIVIKSLSDNFVNIPGLSGASVTGEGTVCLMLDIGEVIKMATGGSQQSMAI